MAAEPAITFLDLACVIGADAAHARTIEDNLRQLYRDALTSWFPSGCLGWNLHLHRHRMLPDEYPRLAVQADGSLDLSPEFVLITPKEIVETLAVDKWPEADRALDLFGTGADGDACRLVAEGPLPDEGSQPRLFIESLAIKLSAAWHFCERHGFPIPTPLRHLFIAWIDRESTLNEKAAIFAPKGRIAIPDAATEIQAALHPGEKQRAMAELKNHGSGELPVNYYRHCENVDEAEKLLLHALVTGELAALVRVNGDDWSLPKG